MSREIKFDLIYKGETRFHHKKYHLCELMRGINKICDIHSMMELIATRQYTNLKDSKGVEVYEKDIVKLEGGQIVVVDLTPKKAIEYGHGDCAFSIHLPIIYGYGVGGDFEVIGNVYENPELLEQVK